MEERMCATFGDFGFFAGLLHGWSAPWVLLLSVLFDFMTYERCQQSWWYDFGFILGVLSIGYLIARSWWLLMLSPLLWTLSSAVGAAPRAVVYAFLGAVLVGIFGLVAGSFFFDFTKLHGVPKKKFRRRS